MKFCLIASALASAAMAGVSGYTDQQAQIALQLSIDAYCGKDAYMKHVFEGPAEGFVPTKVISGILYDVEGYVGYLKSEESIYVVFRGTESWDWRNYYADFDATNTIYEIWPECNCKVHSGFYKASNAVWDHVYKEVVRLKGLYPNYQMKVAGHSLGAALAQMTGMRLV